MNTANKITMSRIFLSIIILLILLLPWHQFGVDIPTYIVRGSMTIDLRYIIAGVLFIIASITDFIDGKLARKYKVQTIYGSNMDTIADKALSIGLIILLLQKNKYIWYTYIE